MSPTQTIRYARPETYNATTQSLLAQSLAILATATFPISAKSTAALARVDYHRIQRKTSDQALKRHVYAKQETQHGRDHA